MENYDANEMAEKIREKTDMDHFEKVEKLRGRMNVTYEEAKYALEQCDWDVLDALVLLEKKQASSESTGKQAFFSTRNASEEEAPKKKKKSDGDNGLKKAWDWCMKVIKKGCDNAFTISRKGKELVTLPVIVVVLLLIFLPISGVALIVGLFLECSYSFSGPDFRQDNAGNGTADQNTEG